MSYYTAVCLSAAAITMFFDSLFDLFYYKREVNRAGYYWTLTFLFIHAAVFLPLIKYIFTH